MSKILNVVIARFQVPDKSTISESLTAMQIPLGIPFRFHQNCIQDLHMRIMDDHGVSAIVNLQTGRYFPPPLDYRVSKIYYNHILEVK